MPVQYPNFVNIPFVQPDYSGIVDFLPRAFQSYKETAEALETPHALRHKRMLNEEDLKKKAFENALNQEFGREMKQAELAEKLAHAQYYQQGGGAYAPTSLGKAFMERDKLISQYGENSPQVKSYDNYIKKTSGEFAQIPGAARTRQINSSLARKSRTFLQPKVTLSTEYLGGGGEYRLNKDKNEYMRTKDPKRKEELKERLVQAALARKLVPDYAVDILTSQGNTATVNAQEEQKKSIMQGWPGTLRVEVPNLPKEILEEANIRHDRTIDELGELRERNFNELKQQSSELMSHEQELSDKQRYDNEINHIMNKFKVSEKIANDLAETAHVNQLTVEEVYKDLKLKGII